MRINRITIKLFAENAAEFPITDIIPVFHQWIREDAVPGLLIDVADYKHVLEGPGILLIGHEVDYALDEGHGRLGLLLRCKKIEGGSLAENLRQTLAWTVQAGQRLIQDTNLRLRADEVEITFPDRLHLPNTAETFAAIQDEVTAVLQTTFGTAAIELTNGAVDERRPLTIQAAITNGSPLSELNQAVATV